MQRLKGKIAVVSGGGQGIGKAIVEKFVSEGAKVAILDWNMEKAQLFADDLGNRGMDVVALQCNIAKRPEVKACFATILENFGTVDILINNAGIIRDAMFHKMTEEQWDEVLAVNGKGLFNCTQEAYWIMKEKKYGKIVSISSTSASGNVGQANYAFSKAGVDAFTKTLAREGGRYNINVNSVRVGFVNSDMIQNIPKQVLQSFIDITAFKRVGKPSEIADLVCFLSSEESTWITGEEILCAGGVMYR